LIRVPFRNVGSSDHIQTPGRHQPSSEEVLKTGLDLRRGSRAGESATGPDFGSPGFDWMQFVGTWAGTIQLGGQGWRRGCFRKTRRERGAGRF
jgi:hypothetical protein